MTLNFPADPSQNPTYEAPNGVTYIWNDSIQSWVVKSVNYDGDYVNRIGDTMSGNLNFASASSPIGLNWGGNPRLSFVNGGDAQLKGNYVVTGSFKFTSDGINFTHNETLLRYKTSTRIRFVDDRTAFAYGGSQMMTITSDGVEYQGNFLKDKNVVTVEYVKAEVENLQDQIDTLTTDLESTIEGVINDKAILLEGNQQASGTKTFKTQVLIDRGEDVGSNAVNSFIIKGKVGSSNQYGVLLKDYRRPDGSSSTDSLMYFGKISADNDIVNKKYVTDNTLKSVSGTSGDTDDTGIRTNSKSNGNQKIYAVKATISQYGVNRRGLLPQGNNDPANADLEIGQMYFNKSTKRVLIRVN